jgi:CheY-like chemotaxis protein/signal transduction histidine kinase
MRSPVEKKPEAALRAQVAQLSLALTRRPARHELLAALELLVEFVPARSALALAGGQVIAEVGLPGEEHAPVVRTASLAISEPGDDEEEVVFFPDLSSLPLEVSALGSRLMMAGYNGAIVIPLHSGGRNFGNFCLWLDGRFEPGPLVEALTDQIGALFGVALERDHRPESAEGGLLALGEMNRLASLGLLLDSSLHALRAPSSSLVIQLDELRRQASELGSLVDPDDSLAVDALRELQQTLDDMAVAATVVRKELTRLLDVAETGSEKDTFQLSRIVHEAVAIARPELEQRGFTIEEAFSSDGSVTGNRRDALQLLLSVLFAMGKADSLGLRSPTLEVSLLGWEGGRQVVVRAPTRDGAEDDITPTLSDSTLSLARKLAAYVEFGAGEIRLSFRTQAEAVPASTSGRPHSQRILIVDDDPMFARALRRALSAHEVRVCGTAGEAELLLLQAEFVPDLVVCDLWLPGKSGRTLHQRIQATLPDVASRFVFVSGAPLTEKDRAYFREVGCRTMTKPVKVDDLLEAAPPAL